jgi:hypothetical protein
MWALESFGFGRGTGAIVVNAAFAAFAVVLAHRTFRRLLQNGVQATLLAALFGLSMSQLAFGAIPETYAIATAGIVAVFLVFLTDLESGRVSPGAWFGVALFAVGVTTSSLAPVGVLFTLIVFATRQRRPVLRIADAALLLLIAMVSLLRFQSALLGTRNPIHQTILLDEIHDIEQKVLKPSPEDPPYGPARTPRELGRNILLLDFVAGYPGRTSLPTSLVKLEYFGYPVRFSPLGFAAAGLWLILWTAGLLTNIRGLVRGDSWPNRYYWGAVMVVVAGDGLLLALYNPVEMYLYTPLILFPVLLLGVSRAAFSYRAYRFALAALVVVLGANNLMVIQQMIR